MHHFKKTTYYLDACCQQSANGRDKRIRKREFWLKSSLQKVIRVTGIFAFKLLRFYFNQESKMRKI